MVERFLLLLLARSTSNLPELKGLGPRAYAAWKPGNWGYQACFSKK